MSSINLYTVCVDKCQTEIRKQYYDLKMNNLSFNDFYNSKFKTCVNKCVNKIVDDNKVEKKIN